MTYKFRIWLEKDRIVSSGVTNFAKNETHFNIFRTLIVLIEIHNEI